MATFKGISTVTISGALTKALDHTTPTDRIGVKVPPTTWATGTGSGQANQWFSDQRTVTASLENLDLYGGLTNAFGETINLVTIKQILIYNRSTTSGEILTISGSALTNLLGGTSPTVKIGPSGVWTQSSPIDGYAITNSSGDVLTVNPGANTITYDLFILGTV